MSWKTRTVGAAARLTMLRFASWATTIAAASVLFARAGSGVVLETVALLVTVVPAAARLDARLDRQRPCRSGGERAADAGDHRARRGAVGRGDEGQTRRQGIGHPDIGGRTRPVVRDDHGVDHAVAHRAGGDEGRLLHARGRPRFRPSAGRWQLLLESTGSGWVAVPVAVLARVVPAAPVWTCTVTSTVKVAPDASAPTLHVTTLAARRARGLVVGDVGGARPAAGRGARRRSPGSARSS